MRTVNRAVVLLRPKQPYVDWVINGYGDEAPPSLETIRQTMHAYLVPLVLAADDHERILRRHFKSMFEAELDAWMTDPKLWPQRRDLRTFRDWFNVEFVEITFDLSGEQPLVRDLDDGV